MNRPELDRANVIQKVVELQLTQGQAAVQLRLSVRQVKRLV